MEIKNKKIGIILAVIFSAALTFMYLKTCSNKLTLQNTSDSSKQDNVPNSGESSKKPKTFDQLKPMDSIVLYGSAMKEMISGEVDLDTFVDTLKEQGLSPTRTEDENEYTGNMTIVRTNNNLPGTRYFHGQFFSNDTGGHELQHLSFDFNGGAGSLAELGEKLSQAMGVNIKPERKRDGYRLYRVNDQYILWAKVLTQDDFSDLKSHPYKAYEQKEVGNLIRIALEQEIH